MPTYKNTVKWCYKTYPTLYVDELDVLQQLFFVIGNGYDWVNGELTTGVSFKESYYYACKDREASNKYYAKAFVKDRESMISILEGAGLTDVLESRVFIPETNDWKLEQQKEVAKRLKYALQGDSLTGQCYFLDQYNNVKRKMYPICEYSKIMNIPKNVKPDWLAAAKKAIQYCDEDNKWLLTSSDKEFIVKAKDRLKEIEAINGN